MPKPFNSAKSLETADMIVRKRGSLSPCPVKRTAPVAKTDNPNIFVPIYAKQVNTKQQVTAIIKEVSKITARKHYGHKWLSVTPVDELQEAMQKVFKAVTVVLQKEAQSTNEPIGQYLIELQNDSAWEDFISKLELEDF